MRDRYGRSIELGDSIQFDPKHIGSPDGQVKGTVLDVKGGIVINNDQPPCEVLTVTATFQIQLPLGAGALVAVVAKDADLARKISQGRSVIA